MSMDDLSTIQIEDITCPISSEIFNDPVIASDGCIYEREMIEKWFENNNTSPLTGLKIDKNIISCIFLKTMVGFFKKSPSKTV